MARRPRLEFEGAIYHVFNRVNTRRDVFGGAAPARLFEGCLFETCDEFGWRLHAFCIVREGFHIALQTPRANLVAGMHWFQSTFAKRLRSFDDGAGPLFQGRYRALPVERGVPLANLVNYIHLRPAATGVVGPDMLAMFRWSSLRRILRPDCPEFLSPSDWIGDVHEIAGERDRLAAYERLLLHLARDPDRNVAIGMRGMTRGPVIGSQDFRKSITDRVDAHSNEEDWAETLDRLLDSHGRTRGDLSAGAKGASWKVELAFELRSAAGASLDWLARELFMGTVNSVSHYLWLMRKAAKTRKSA